MNKPRKITYRNKSNIFDMMKDRKLRHNVGNEKSSSFKPISEFEPTSYVTKRTCQAKTKDAICDQAKQVTRDQMIKYLQVNKTNYELLNFVLHPKIKPPQVLPITDPMKAKAKQLGWFSQVKSHRSDHRITQHPRVSTSYSAFKLGRNRPVSSQSNHKRWSIPYCYAYPLRAGSNSINMPCDLKALEIAQHSRNSSEQDQEIFYDVESFTKI